MLVFWLIVILQEESCLRLSAREIVEKMSRLVEELLKEKHQILMSESSSEPLVEAVAK